MLLVPIHERVRFARTSYLKSGFRFIKNLLILLFTLSSHSILAGTVWLKNGDKISGTLVNKITNKVVIKTTYAGDIKLNWADIHSIDAEQPLLMMLSDGSIISGRLVHDKQGQIVLDTETNTPLINTELEEIQYVNPSKDLTGEGYVWSGNINLGATFNSGNSDNQNLQINGESVLRGLKNRYTVQGYSYWSQDNGDETQNNTRIRGQFDHFFSKKWYGYAKNTLENDRFRDIKLRNNLGVGTGYQLMETDQLTLSIEGGLSWIHQDYYQDADSDRGGVHWAINYNQYLWDSFVQAFHRHDLLYTPSAPSQILLYSQTGLRFPFLLGLSATTQVDYNYDSRPADDRNESDTRALFTLGYSWQ